MPRVVPILTALVFGGFIGLPVLALLLRAGQGTIIGLEGSTEAIGMALALSLSTSTATLAVAIVVGTPVAYALARVPFPGRGVIGALVDVPILLPPAVAGLALLMAFGRRGLVGTWIADAGVSLAFSTVGVVIAQSFVSLPFYIRATRAAFVASDRELEAAAMIDGATGWQVLWKVTIPLARPAIESGAILCWSRALGEFGATLMFAGSLQGRTQTMPLAIYAMFESDLNGAVVLGALFVAIAVIIIALTARQSD